MSHKSKGIAVERELVHLLQKKGFAAIRVAGSGSTATPSTDILAGNGHRILSIECKSTTSTSRYIEKTAIVDFITFSRQFGAEPWIAFRLLRKPWRFVLCEDLIETDKNFVVNAELCEQKGLFLEELLGESKVDVRLSKVSEVASLNDANEFSDDSLDI